MRTTITCLECGQTQLSGKMETEQSIARKRKNHKCDDSDVVLQRIRNRRTIAAITKVIAGRGKQSYKIKTIYDLVR